MPTETYPVVNQPFIGLFPTPSLADWYVFVSKDARIPDFARPAIGAAHPDTAKYPGFQFVKATPAPDGTQIESWLFVAPRLLQEVYNADTGYSLDSTRWPRYRRTYLLPVAGYTPVALGTADPVYPTALLSEPETAVDPDDERLRALYLKVVRIYSVYPDVTNAGDLLELEKLGFVISYPFGSTAFPHVEWTLTAQAATSSQALTVNCPIPGYTGLTLIGQEYDYRKQVGKGFKRIYELVPGPLIVEVEYHEKLRSPVLITKQIVATSTIPANAGLLLAAQLALAPGVIQEWKDFNDAMRSVHIVTTLPAALDWLNGGADLAYFGSINHSFPNEILFRDSPLHTIIGDTAGTGHVRIDVSTEVRVTSGYSGPCEALIIERITFDPVNPLFRAGLPQITLVEPRADLVKYWWHGSDAINVIAEAKGYPIPESLHGNLFSAWQAVNMPVFTGQLSGDTLIEATRPTTMFNEAAFKASTNWDPTPYNTPYNLTGVWLVKSIENERVIAGAHLFRIIFVKHPGPGAYLGPLADPPASSSSSP